MSNDPSIGIVETISFLDSQENDASSNNNDTDMLNEPLLNTTTTTSTTANNYHHLHHKFKTTITSCIQSILQIYSDQSVSSCLTLTKGLSIPFSIGIFLGLIIPKNPNLPSPFYQYISSILGYTYFVSWSVSFYPQIITNYKRKKIDGLSVDASILAVLNYICYTIYTSFFFWDGTIRQEYKDRNGENSEVTVMSNDVAFAMHSLILTSITLCQVVYYKGFVEQPMSWVCGAIVMGTLGISLVYVICIGVKVPGFLWIDFLYMMGTIKLVLTIMTYVPQIVLNFQRRSTAGFNIWNVIFDFSGGLLSLAQLFFDCLDMNDFSGILGNWAKFVLSLITLVFDGILFLQHYVLFRNNNTAHSSSGYSLNDAVSEDEALYTTMVEVNEDGEEILTEFV